MSTTRYVDKQYEHPSADSPRLLYLALQIDTESSNFTSNISATPLNESSVSHHTTDEALSPVEATLFALFALLCILTTVFGNALVVLSVFTYVPLKGVQNLYIVSLAGADLAVALLVMPFNVASFVATNNGSWQFGVVWCNIWLTLDILCCTASILHLCAIAIDRYYAIHDPINYAVKRTHRRVFAKIIVVWLASGVISIPPLFGWNNSSSQSLYDEKSQRCQLTDERSFVVYSASGSFYIPLLIMSFVYVKIYQATRARLRARAKSVSRFRLLASPSCFYSTGVADAPVGGENHGEACEQDEPLSPGGNIQITEDYPSVSPRFCEMTAKMDFGAEIRSSPSWLKSADEDAGCCVELTRDVTLEADKVTSPVDRNKLSVVGAKCARLKAETKALELSIPVPSRPMTDVMQARQRISLTKERRAARTMGIIMGAFVICWLPFFLMYIIFPFCDWCAANADKRLVNFIVWLGYVNSALNPIIYTVFNIDFRRAFQNLLFRRCCAVTR